MRPGKYKNILKSAYTLATSFLLFFATIASVVTFSFLLFFHTVELPAEDVRRIAPVVFINVIILTIIFVIIDALRRKFTVKRPAKEIQRVLFQLMNGDFSARINVDSIMDSYNNFGIIAENINLLAKELSGVETLRTDFIANVSHELKTPLAVMQNYATMLQQPDLSDEKRIEYAKAISDTSHRLASLITNILKLNKLENQQIFPSVQKYNLSEQLCECLLQFENVWEKKEINIEADISENIEILADAELFSLVWNNLLSNAFKFTESGGTVSVSLNADDKFATIKVSDTGCGMTAQVGTHIFEKFYQGDTSHATRGNGLGLALVKRVVDITRSEISVESTLGKGSTFTVKIRKQQP